jgi:hypothetical protein
MELEVPDDYQVTSTHPEKFWDDLNEKLHYDVPDIWCGRVFDGIEDCEFYGFNIDDMVLDYLQRVYISEDGKEDIVINLEHIPLHR